MRQNLTCCKKLQLYNTLQTLPTLQHPPKLLQLTKRMLKLTTKSYNFTTYFKTLQLYNIPQTLRLFITLHFAV